MATLVAKFEWNHGDRLALMQRDLELGGIVQKTVDTAIIRYCQPYVPFETGTLAYSPYRASPPGSGQVIYETPYARYLYYGMVMGPNFPVEVDAEGNVIRWTSIPGRPKHLTGRYLQYNQDTNPLAGPFWAVRMKANHLQDIVEEAKAVAGLK